QHRAEVDVVELVVPERGPALNERIADDRRRGGALFVHQPLGEAFLAEVAREKVHVAGPAALFACLVAQAHVDLAEVDAADGQVAVPALPVPGRVADLDRERLLGWDADQDLPVRGGRHALCGELDPVQRIFGLRLRVDGAEGAVLDLADAEALGRVGGILDRERAAGLRVGEGQLVRQLVLGHDGERSGGRFDRLARRRDRLAVPGHTVHQLAGGARRALGVRCFAGQAADLSNALAVLPTIAVLLAVGVAAPLDTGLKVRALRVALAGALLAFLRLFRGLVGGGDARPVDALETLNAAGLHPFFTAAGPAPAGRVANRILRRHQRLAGVDLALAQHADLPAPTARRARDASVAPLIVRPAPRRGRQYQQTKRRERPQSFHDFYQYPMSSKEVNTQPA